jgi:hypothetical protein
MPAISKAWVAISDAAVDPDSPGDATLMTGIRDDLVHLREWLGASFFAGAVQDHNHDGANSAQIEVGPNLMRNGSFESGESGWIFTDFSGGSHAVSASTRHHGAKSISFTSTVLANGGGDALSNEFVACGGKDLIFQLWNSASAINVSSKAEINWYDGAESLISTSTIVTNTDTPTAATLTRVRIAAPATARFFKIRLTGGIPGSGSATGTIFFDGVTVSDWSLVDAFIEPNVITQGSIANAAVGQGELKTTTGDVTASATSNTNLTLPGGEYGFYPTIGVDVGGGITMDAHIGVLVGQGLRANIGLAVSAGGNTVRARQRYIQASPPYDLGDGEVPIFVFALLDSLGKVIATYGAEDPPWANNGPTDIRPSFIAKDGRLMQIRPVPISREALLDPATADAELAKIGEAEVIEVTQALKQADMPLIPHPFLDNDLTGKTVVLLDPVGGLTEKLWGLHRAGEFLGRLLHDGHLSLDNVPLVRTTPPDVIAVAASWKLTV